MVVVDTHHASPPLYFYKTNYTHIKRNEVWWAELDGIGSEQTGRRPVLIIQNDVGNRHSPTTIIAPISSRVSKKLPTHVLLPTEESGLPTESIVLLEQIKVIDKSRLIKKSGTLEANTMERVERAILVSIGIGIN